MNKSELIGVVAENANVSKRVTEAVIDSTIEAITDALASGNNVRLISFGNFEIKARAGRKGRNPKTKEVIEILPSKVPVFKASKSLKDRVSGK